ncbi:MAG: beta-ketoacyl-[acyl-carrier-protein] synthase II, partial [Burkholderiales bacterium]|nr:beta-ketoacyl-[acyl-carrier-protein] synthase II [Burkholderiales bacterium]
SAEDAAIAAVFGDGCLCSSTKGWTGHTQGAAGITEAVISFLSISAGLVPANLNAREIDPALCTPVVLETLQRPLKRVLSNSFGFGGNNCALVFEALA